MKKTMALILTMLFLFVSACSPAVLFSETENPNSEMVKTPELKENIQENTPYYSAEEVAAYLVFYGELPPNYLTKNEARDLGWIAEDGNLWDVTDKMVIGGDRFGNREGLLPKAEGRQYYEADVNYYGGHRGSERLVYSNDGLIFYTDDHYDRFEDWTPEGRP